MTEYRVKDYHRDMVTKYYGRLYQRYGADRFIARVPLLSRIVWTKAGLILAEKHLRQT